MDNLARTAANEAAALTDDAPAYFVIHQHVTDMARFDAYVAAVTPLIAARGATLVAAGEPETVEGGSIHERTVVFLWPSAGVFREFWNSAEYAEVHALREGASEWFAQLVPALPAADAEPEIRDVLLSYADAARRGDRAAMASVFHPEAHVRGRLRGDAVDSDVQGFLDFVGSSGPAGRLAATVELVSASGDAAVARVDCRDWHGVHYTDLFTLQRRDGRWQITSKIFDAHDHQGDAQ